MTDEERASRRERLPAPYRITTMHSVTGAVSGLWPLELLCNQPDAGGPLDAPTFIPTGGVVSVRGHDGFYGSIYTIRGT